MIYYMRNHVPPPKRSPEICLRTELGRTLRIGDVQKGPCLIDMVQLLIEALPPRKTTSFFFRGFIKAQNFK